MESFGTPSLAISLDALHPRLANLISSILADRSRHHRLRPRHWRKHHLELTPLSIHRMPSSLPVEAAAVKLSKRLRDALSDPASFNHWLYGDQSRPAQNTYGTFSQAPRSNFFTSPRRLKPDLMLCTIFTILTPPQWTPYYLRFSTCKVPFRVFKGRQPLIAFYRHAGRRFDMSSIAGNLLAMAQTHFEVHPSVVQVRVYIVGMVPRGLIPSKKHKSHSKSKDSLKDFVIYWGEFKREGLPRGQGVVKRTRKWDPEKTEDRIEFTAALKGVVRECDRQMRSAMDGDRQMRGARAVTDRRKVPGNTTRKPSAAGCTIVTAPVADKPVKAADGCGKINATTSREIVRADAKDYQHYQGYSGSRSGKDSNNGNIIERTGDRT